jgi:hypothetical protein
MLTPIEERKTRFFGSVTRRFSLETTWPSPR